MHNDKSFVTINSENNIRDELKKIEGFSIGHKNITSHSKHIEQTRFYIHNKSLDIIINYK